MTTPEEILKRFNLEGRYKEFHELGKGGMGSVYSAIDTRLQVRVAVKFLNNFGGLNSSIVRFQQEAKALSRLKNDNIVRIFDFHYSESGDLYLVMEYVDGENIQQRINKLGVFSPAQTLRVGLDLSKALQHAHAQGIVHRDLKPENVVIDQKGNPKILDFGIAKLLSTTDQFGTMTRPGQALGSPLYMSPEQLQGNEATTLTDVYGLALLMYHMLTDRSPFASETVTELLEARLKNPPQPLTQTFGQSKLIEQLDKLFAKALQPDPASRHESMESFGNEIERLLIDPPHETDVSDDSEVVRADNQTRAKKKMVSQAMLAVLGTTMLSAGAWFGLKIMIDAQNRGAAKINTKMITKMELLPKYVEEYDPQEAIKNRAPNPPGFRYEDNGRKPNAFSQPKEPVTEEVLDRLPTSQIRYLSFEGSPTLTAEHLKKLSGLNLFALDMSRTALGAPALEAIHEIPNLRWLNLSNSDVSDETIKHLGIMPNLHRLELHNCKSFSNAGLSYVTETYPNLHFLDIGETGITSLKALKRLDHLIRLRIGRTEIQDEDITYLSEPLHECFMIGCDRITDRSLGTLGKIKSLKHIAISKCPGISEGAVYQFMRLHQNCKVGWSSKLERNRVRAAERIIKDDTDAFIPSDAAR
jgi:serine/threonine protein kinase